MISPGGTSFFSRLLDVFRVDENGRGSKWCWPVVFAFVAINLIVLYNAIAHDPRFGYDAPGHIAYVKTLAEGRLPSPADSHEFFSPPLPYVPAAIAWKLFDGSASDGRQIFALKVAQIVQFFGSIVVCWCVLAIVKLACCGRSLIPRPSSFIPSSGPHPNPLPGGEGTRQRWMLLAALVGVGIVPAYYRTFAMVRGEPMMVALLLAGTYLTLKTFALDRPTLRHGILAGVLLGGAVLSRQWAFFALPALGVVGLWRLMVDAPSRRQTLVSGIALLASAAIVGGWYYAHLRYEYGSIRAFNRPPDEEEREEQPTKATSSLVKSMASSPVRHAFDTHPGWLFYADTWGDYWRYFVISARDQKGRLVKSVLVDRLVRSGKAKESNAATMPAYLGRACVVSVVPTTLMIGGVAFGVWQFRRRPQKGDDAKRIVLPIVTLMTLSTIAGYSWFVASYPNDHLDTVKASYPIQMFPLIAIVSAAMWCALNDQFPRFAKTLGMCVIIVFVHNLPTMVTRYTLF